MIMVDECHHAASETIQKILRTARAKYVYGVTATPMREDGLEKSTICLSGRFVFALLQRKERLNRESGIWYIEIYSDAVLKGR